MSGRYNSLVQRRKFFIMQGCLEAMRTRHRKEFEAIRRAAYELMPGNERESRLVKGPKEIHRGRSA